MKQFAKVVSKELLQVDEFMFEAKRSDGATQFINAYRAISAFGFRIEALSNESENIRGLQGVAVIDEAAFHGNVREVFDAVNALLIWGGKIRIISPHNGVQDPFNELIKKTAKARFLIPSTQSPLEMRSETAFSSVSASRKVKNGRLRKKPSVNEKSVLPMAFARQPRGRSWIL